MNQYDLDNLRFLLSRSPKQLREWYDTASDSDLCYAGQLMDQYAALLEDEILSTQIERKIEQMPVLLEAQAVIAAIQ